MKTLDFLLMKEKREKISVVTCYDYTSAKVLAKTSIDCLLVGDSLAMTVHGFQDTIPATMEMMTMHTAAVKRGAGDKFVISDLPFLSYRKSFNKSISAAQLLMQAGAHAVKLEGSTGNLKLIKHLTDSGVPVMGHLGLTPQSLHLLGGWKVQGKTAESAVHLQQCARDLEAAGCFAIVLECIPADLAQQITQSLQIPTIGIGAGPHTDGQVLVYHDLLGLQTEFKPKFKFLKVFANGLQYLTSGIENYVQAVKSGGFPQDEHCYKA